MRLMFVAYLVLVGFGLTLYIAIGIANP